MIVRFSSRRHNGLFLFDALTYVFFERLGWRTSRKGGPLPAGTWPGISKAYLESPLTSKAPLQCTWPVQWAIAEFQL